MAGGEEGAGGPAEEPPFPSEGDSEGADDIWQELKHHLGLLAAGGQSEPTRLALQSLSSFLSRVTDQMSSKSTILRLESVVPLWTEDVMRLNVWLSGELEKHTRFLSNEHSFDASDQLHSSPELITQTLRCCMRILPLIDCCNTGMSAQCAASLKSILQLLCSPSTLHSIRAVALSLNKQLGATHNANSTCTGYEIRGTGVVGAELPYFHSLHALENINVFHKPYRMRLEECSAYEEIKIRSKVVGKDAECDLSLNGGDKGLRLLKLLEHQVDLICGMLEVYIDELLSCPDLSEVFLWTQDEEDRGALSFNRQMEVVLEAACVHALSSWQKIHVPLQPLETAEQLRVIPSLTLTAAVMLLDIVTEDGAPVGFLTHIVNLVRRSIDTHGILGERIHRKAIFRSQEILELVEVADPEKASSWFQDEVKRAMHYKKQSPDLENTSHPRLCLHMSLSILETAVRLYAQIFEMESDLSQHRGLGSVLSRAGGMCSENLYSVPETSVGDGGNCCWGCHSWQTAQVCRFPVHGKNCILDRNLFRGSQEGYMSTEKTEDFVAALLRLISSALYRIASELHRIKQLSAVAGHLDHGLAREIQVTLSCVSAVFRSSLSITDQKLPAGKDSVSGTTDEPDVLNVEDSMRYTWKILSDVVRSEIQRGVADHLFEEYFHVLKSLVVLVHEGNGHETSEGEQSAQTENAVDNTHLTEPAARSLTVESDEDSRTQQLLASGFSPAIEASTQMSPATLKIFQKLKGRNPQTVTFEPGPTGSEHECKISSDQENVATFSIKKRKKELRGATCGRTAGNPYVQSCIASDKSLDGDSFEDLNDFIVCKQGRNYVEWKKERQKYIKRKRARSIWRRMEEREKLLAKLALTEID